MIDVQKYNVPLKRKNKLINLLAIFIMLVGLFLMTAQPTFAKQAQSVCKSGNGATCWCSGSCGANATSCWCN